MFVEFYKSTVSHKTIATPDPSFYKTIDPLFFALQHVYSVYRVLERKTFPVVTYHPCKAKILEMVRKRDILYFTMIFFSYFDKHFKSTPWLPYSVKFCPKENCRYCSCITFECSNQQSLIAATMQSLLLCLLILFQLFAISWVSN